MQGLDELVTFAASLFGHFDELCALETFGRRRNGDVAERRSTTTNVFGNLSDTKFLIGQSHDLVFEARHSVLVHAREVARLARRFRVGKRRSTSELCKTLKVQRRSEESRSDDDNICFHDLSRRQRVEIRHCLENDRVQRTSRAELLNLSRPLAEQLRRRDDKRCLGRNRFDRSINFSLLGRRELELVRQDDPDGDGRFPVTNLIGHDAAANHL